MEYVQSTSMFTIPNTPRAGLILVTIAFLIAPGMDVFAKLLTETLSPGMIVIGRFASQTVLMLPLLLLVGQLVRPRAGHLAAGFFLAFALLTINAALAVMPIANAIAIFFVEPLILTLLSALILGERIGWRRVAAVLVGLVGAMVVIRPNFEEYGVTAFLPLATAVFFACYILVTRVMSQQGDRFALQFWTGVAAMVVMLAASGITHTTALPEIVLAVPDLRETILFVAMGAFAVVAHQMIVNALARTEASVIAPMQYLEIISATIFGWWIFGDFPDLLTWIGAGIIIASGVYVFHRERQATGGPT